MYDLTVFYHGDRTLPGFLGQTPPCTTQSFHLTAARGDGDVRMERNERRRGVGVTASEVESGGFAANTHSFEITRGIHGTYGWKIRVSGDGSSVEAVEASVDVCRVVDAGMRRGLSS